MGSGSSPVKIWREAKKRYQYLGKIGRLVSFTKIRQGPTGFEKNAPYWVGIVEFGNGEKITGQIKSGAKSGKLKTGMKVVGVLRKLKEGEEKGVIEYGVKFKVI